MKNFLPFILLILSLKGFSQNEKLERLMSNIENASSNSRKIDTILAISTIHINYNNLDTALIYLNKSDSILEKTTYGIGKAKTAYNRAIVLKKRRQYKKAKSEFQKALDIAEQKENKQLQSTILTELGGVYIKMKNYDIAADYLVDAIQILREIKNPSTLVTALNYFGDLNLKYDRVKTVAAQLEEARRIGLSAKSEKELLQNYLLMRKLEDKLGNTQAAREWMNNYRKLRNNIKDPVPITNSNANLSDANPYILDDYSISDSLESDRIEINAIDENTTQNSTAKKQSYRKETNATKLNRLRTFTYGLIFLISTMAILMFLLYRNSKNAKGKTVELSAEDLKKIDSLTERNEYLEKEIDVKNRLFSIISHDLKDALTSTKGFIDLIKDGTITDDEFKELIPEVSNNADNASLLILNLLNWSKSQMKSLDAKGRMFDIKDVITDKISLLEARINYKNIIIENNITQDFVYADRNMIEIVAQNLLANAIKFSNTGDKITLKNTIENGNCLLSVSDTGVGISKENQEKLFSDINFTTIGTENEKGNGLGLSICKEMVELNNGRIWVESEINKGTTFFVELPKYKEITL